jgi:hypothetical protein
MNMTQGTNQEPTGSARSLPTNHLIGVIDQLQEAEQAVQALQDAGYAAQDILLIPSQAFIEGIQERQQQSSRFANAVHIFFASTEESYPGDVYLQQAQRGAQVLAVYAPTVEQAQQIAPILSKYHIQLLKYFGRWATTNFPS